MRRVTEEVGDDVILILMVNLVCMYADDILVKASWLSTFHIKRSEAPMQSTKIDRHQEINDKTHGSSSSSMDQELTLNMQR